MIRFRSVVVVLLAFNLFGSALRFGHASVQVAMGAAPQEIVHVGFCDVVKNPLKHHDMVVRIEATMDFAEGFLYDLRCNSPDWWIYPTLDTTHPPDLTTWHAAVSELPEGEERVRVALVGRFSAPLGTAYGTGSLRQQIVILEYENVEVVPPDEPGPMGTKGPAPLTQLDRELRELAFHWIEMTTVGDVARLSELASRDYVWVDDELGAVTKRQLLRNSGRLKRPELVNGESFSGGFQVFQHGDIAVVVHVFEDYKGSAMAKYTNVLRKKGLGWSLVFTRSTRHK